jgi:putative salt-induced outer membrane protein
MTISAGGLQADVLNLADGSRIVGTVEEIDESKALLSGTFAGELTVPRDAIVSIETADTVTVQLDDHSYLTGRLEIPTPGNIVIEVPAVGARPIDLANVRGIYRADPLELQRRELAVKVEAQANVGVNLTSGNTETENQHLEGQVVTRTKRNRYTLAGEYNQEESENILVKENWRGLVKYDHFVSEQWFCFSSATFESDEFADLQLRSALAAGIGYQFFETDTRSLSLEAGPSYIDENFEVAEDDSYLGSRWAIIYDQQIWNGLSYFLYNEGLLGFEDTSDLTIRTRTGFSLDISDHIIARIQTAIDWDKSPPPDTEGTDYEHSLTVGYRF